MIQKKLTNNPDKYNSFPDDPNLGTSLTFTRFLDELMSRCNKDVPFNIIASTYGRSVVYREMMNRHGFTKVMHADFGGIREKDKRRRAQYIMKRYQK